MKLGHTESSVQYSFHELANFSYNQRRNVYRNTINLILFYDSKRER